MVDVCADSVLLVDDNDIDLFINKKIIEFNNFTNKLVSLSSGKDALNYLQNVDKEALPQIIFLDLNMPLSDGFQFLSEFSKLGKSIRSGMSIVVLTSSNNPNDKDKVEKNSDVLYFLSKPLNEEKLQIIRDRIKHTA